MIDLETTQLSSVETLRHRARQNVDQGAVTEGYSADREEIIKLLNGSLATELVCVLRYKRHYFMANGLKASIAADEFLEHAEQEAEHADKLAERIVQLGGEPEFNPDLLSKNSHAQYVAGNTLKEMVYEDLVAERVGTQSLSTLKFCSSSPSRASWSMRGVGAPRSAPPP